MFLKIQLSLRDRGVEIKLINCKFSRPAWGSEMKPHSRAGVSSLWPAKLSQGAGAWDYLPAETPELASAAICSVMVHQNKAEHYWG